MAVSLWRSRDEFPDGNRQFVVSVAQIKRYIFQNGLCEKPARPLLELISAIYGARALFRAVARVGWGKTLGGQADRRFLYQIPMADGRVDRPRHVLTVGR
jgi:hypothetical protein